MPQRRSSSTRGRDLIIRTRPSFLSDNSTTITAVALLATAAASWVFVFHDAAGMSRSMDMQPAPLLIGGASFCARWGIMMIAMMLPSAMSMMLLYRAVRAKLIQQGEVSIPTWCFAGIYIVVWTMFGVPVFAMQTMVAHWSAESPSFARGIPDAIPVLLMLAGAFQFSALKRACLRACESPLGFLMQRWRSGYRTTAMLAFQHAMFCIGCCWALMVILVAVGAMSLPWVLSIAAIVAAEKLLSPRWHSRELTGIVLLLLGVLVALKPGLAATIR